MGRSSAQYGLAIFAFAADEEPGVPTASGRFVHVSIERARLDHAVPISGLLHQALCGQEKDKCRRQTF